MAAAPAEADWAGEATVAAPAEPLGDLPLGRTRCSGGIAGGVEHPSEHAAEASADPGMPDAITSAGAGEPGPVAGGQPPRPKPAEAHAGTGAISDCKERAEGEAEASGLEPLSDRQKEEVVAAVEAVRAAGMSGETTKHGWIISFHVRKPAGGRGSRGAPRGDLSMIDQRDGNKYASVVSLKRRLGLTEPAEAPAPPPRRAAALAEVAPAEAGEEELAGRPRRSRAQVKQRGGGQMGVKGKNDCSYCP